MGLILFNIAASVAICALFWLSGCAPCRADCRDMTYDQCQNLKRSYARIEHMDDRDGMDALAEKTVKVTDVKFKDEELSLEEQLDLLKDEIFNLEGRIDLIEMRRK